MHQDSLVQQIIDAAYARYAGGKPEVGDAQLVVLGHLCEQVHQLRNNPANKTGSQGLVQRVRSAATPTVGAGGFGAIVFAIMDKLL